MRILELRKEELKDSLLLVGLPTRGLIGPILSSYLVDELKMWPVAAVLDSRFPPTTVVHDGIAIPPVRFYVSAERCGPDGRCDKLLVLTSDIPVDPAFANEMAVTVLTWAREKGVRHVVTLEGVELDGKGNKTRAEPVLRGLEGANRDLHLKHLKVEPLPDGVVTSLSSAFLNAARELKIDIVALFSGSQEGPDEKAAVQSLSRVEGLLPHIDLGSKELVSKVRSHTTEQNRRVRHQARRMKDMQRVFDMMYR